MYPYLPQYNGTEVFNNLKTIKINPLTHAFISLTSVLNDLVCLKTQRREKKDARIKSRTNT
jgi:hypothetical protein